MESKFKHLEMIQSIIQRMANNSFLLKGWTITLIVAIFALSDNDMNQNYFGLVYIPVLAFWFLDSYYLQLERKYKQLYNDVRQKQDIDFDLNIENINAQTRKKQDLLYLKCLFSACESIFYIPILILLTIIFKNEILFVICSI